MNLLSAPVLGGAALCVSPALYSAWEGSLGLEAALTRYLVAVPICWIVLSIFEAMVGPVDRTAKKPDAQPPAAPGSSSGPLGYSAQQVGGFGTNSGGSAPQLGSSDPFSFGDVDDSRDPFSAS
ncbi:hypothetical protein [Nocardioides sp. GY 10127]|uniref:hypothetical protein n=1 Tax=Nocardioides sp. GY 10127 TaxID=2569762 RepID=UPI0010A82648|nr:hypothetical protein [Nocardioides sp. GY 10127]TIC78646.1 hypothetical protein E8D37_19540 [Nocardioides sp. GY 10127]